MISCLGFVSRLLFRKTWEQKNLRQNWAERKINQSTGNWFQRLKHVAVLFLIKLIRNHSLVLSYHLNKNAIKTKTKVCLNLIGKKGCNFWEFKLDCDLCSLKRYSSVSSSCKYKKIQKRFGNEEDKNQLLLELCYNNIFMGVIFDLRTSSMWKFFSKIFCSIEKYKVYHWLTLKNIKKTTKKSLFYS